MAKVDEVKAKISIPMYFYNIIVPQLGSYYSNYEVNFDVRPVACCPLHDEDTPSMRYYEETNTFYCFGCRKGGDVISLHRYYTERQTGSMPTWGESIEFLYDFFIKGNESAKVIKKNQSLVEKPAESTAIDLARYSKYTSVLENQLIQDHHVPEETKRKIWKAMDEADILVAKNFANAVDAMRYIQNVVSEVIV